MMNLYNILEDEYNKVTNRYSNSASLTYNKNEVKKLFSFLFTINFLKNRIELKKNFFSNKYFEITYSCLMESFLLVLDAHYRGSLLVARCALENSIKHSMSVNNIPNISQRSYTENYNTFKCHKTPNEQLNLLITKNNERKKTLYSKLSGISHSLTPDSLNLNIEYLLYKQKENPPSNETLDKLTKCYEYIFLDFLFISYYSIEQWDSDLLLNILKIPFGKKRSMSLLKSIKNKY